MFMELGLFVCFCFFQMGSFSLLILSVRNQYIAQYYIFYLNSNSSLKVLYVFVSVVKWVIPTVPIQLLIATHP